MNRLLTNSLVPEAAGTFRPADLPLDKPTSARTHDFSPGGKDSFGVGRVAAEQVQAATPNTYDLVRENRRSLPRVGRYLAQVGIDQYLDLGSGPPTRGSVHRIV